MHPILEQFCDKWVWPTMPSAPGAEFRLRLTREQCLKGWEISLQRTLAGIERELATNDEDWKKDRALRGYAAEGVHMSIEQMSGQLLSVDIADQERYIDLQRMRARQVWDECKHSTPTSCSAKTGSRTSASSRTSPPPTPSPCRPILACR